MERLLPDELKHLWGEVDAGRLSHEDFAAAQDRLIGEYRQLWTGALILPGEPDLETSLLGEVAAYAGVADLAEVRRRCQQASAALKDEWHEHVDAGSRESVERFYHASDAYIYELMWWHTLVDDLSPLAYVAALDFGTRHGCRRYLDFGAGVGSGAILFGRHGDAVTIADISAPLLAFSQSRLARRAIPATAVDLTSEPLPRAAVDLVTAMDVFEHLADPGATVDAIADALVPGGFLFGRFHAEPDELRPQHIVLDFSPVFRRLAERGFREVWRDEWLWGHQAFRKDG
ncbi:MAG TPA: class I SAM-dependent methyltransferase [Vicinamibacterales bacterium]|nr:class I SAM-dependent methyltransferase [Vicinamibacterales bacterium]